MIKMINIIPAPLTDDANELKGFIKRSENIVERFQIDIIDGIFADNKTVTPVAMYEVETPLKIDYHLMVNIPERWVERCVKGKGDRIIAQIELMKSQTAFVEKVRGFGIRVGLAIDLDTHISQIDPDMLEEVDVVLVMSVKAGFGGQMFEKKALNKIKTLSDLRSKNNFNYKICVDGGINEENIGGIVKAKADEASIGKSLFKGNLEYNISHYRNLLNEK